MNRNWDIIGKRKIFFIISACLMALAIILTPFLLKLDIGFTGGSIITYSFDGDMAQINLNEFQDVVETSIDKKVSINTSKNFVSNTSNIVVTVSEKNGLTSDAVSKLSDTINEKYSSLNLKSEIQNVSPSMGQEFFIKCLVALLAAALLIIIYVAIRFRKIGGWSAGFMGVVALVHDAVVVYLAFLVFGFALDDNFIAAVLTILGYSINDTIVIYDRVRENEKIYGNRMPVGELVNKSINQTLGRTINTSVAVVLSLVVVAIVAFVFNIPTILSFTLPLIVGMISGTYSTLCIATPLWVTWQERKAKKAIN